MDKNNDLTAFDAAEYDEKQYWNKIITAMSKNI